MVVGGGLGQEMWAGDVGRAGTLETCTEGYGILASVGADEDV